MPKTVLPMTDGFYETDSAPISAQNCVNMFPVLEDDSALSGETLRGIPGVTLVVADDANPQFSPLDEPGDGSPGENAPSSPESPDPPDGDSQPEDPDAPLTDLDEDSNNPLIPDGDSPDYSNDPRCQPFACDSIDAVIPTWANGLLEVTSQFDPDLPAFGDVFPLDGLEPQLQNGTVITDWGNVVPRQLTLNETVPVISPCNFDPVAAVRGSQFTVLNTEEQQAFVIFSADGDNAFPPSSLWTIGYTYTSNLGTTVDAANLFFRDQGDGTARLEFECSGVAFPISDPSSESSNYSFEAPAIPFTLGGSDNWYVAFVKVDVGTPFKQDSLVNGTEYWYMPLLVQAKVWNMDGEVSSIFEQFNIGNVANPSGNITVSSLEFTELEFAFDSKRVAAGSASVALATADTEELILSVLRNRSTYEVPGFCNP